MQVSVCDEGIHIFLCIPPDDHSSSELACCLLPAFAMLEKVTLINYGPTVIAVSWVETFLVLIFVGLRVYTRSAIAKGGFGWDDVFMIASAVSFTPRNATL